MNINKAYVNDLLRQDYSRGDDTRAKLVVELMKTVPPRDVVEKVHEFGKKVEFRESIERLELGDEISAEYITKSAFYKELCRPELDSITDINERCRVAWQNACNNFQNRISSKSTATGKKMQFKNYTPEFEGRIFRLTKTKKLSSEGDISPELELKLLKNEYIATLRNIQYCNWKLVELQQRRDKAIYSSYKLESEYSFYVQSLMLLSDRLQELKDIVRSFGKKGMVKALKGNVKSSSTCMLCLRT
jgi:hypothetical protein